MELALQWITAVSALLGAGAVFYVAKQLCFAAWTKAQETFVDEKFMMARGKVYARIPNDAEAENFWTEDDYMVCRKMDQLAALAKYLRPLSFGEDLVLKTWRDPLAKSWIVLHSLVQEERNKTPGWPKWEAFEKLGKNAMDSLNLKEIPKDELLNPHTEDEKANKPNSSE